MNGVILAREFWIKEIKHPTGQIRDDIQTFLDTNFKPGAMKVYLTLDYDYAIVFFDPKYETLFRLKYAEYL